MRCAPLVSFLFALAAAAAPGDRPIIAEADVTPHLKDLARRIEQMQKRELTAGQVIEYYAQQAAAKAPPKEKAIRHYMYGYVLQNAKGQKGEARREYLRALQAYPRFPGVHIALAVLAFERDLDTAESHVKKALRMERDSIPALLMRARIAGMRKEYDRALRFLNEAQEVEITGDAFTMMAGIYVEQFYKSYDDEQKAEFAKKAVGIVNSWLVIEPDIARAHLMKARVHLNLGQVKKAVETLENALAKANFDDRDKLRFLQLLRSIYEVTGSVDGMKSTLVRMRKNPEVDGSMRERIDERIKDIESKGRTAFVVWQVENLIKVLENDGIDVDRRRDALKKLLAFYMDDKVLLNVHLRKLGWEVFKRSFKVLIDAPAELTIEMMRFFREKFPDPHLIRILVHFTYPYANERTTPKVRAEVIRTLASCAGDASLPSLLYSLRDEPGIVLREVDKALCKVAERRSPVGSGIAPLNDAQKKLARRKWLEWAHSEDGAERLAASFAALSKVVKVDPAHTRGLRAAPLVDHTVNLVLLDGDMKWPAWKAAYEFLVKYWGKDLRPPERRGKAITEPERAAVTEALRKEWAGAAPDNPGPEAGDGESG